MCVELQAFLGLGDKTADYLLNSLGFARQTKCQKKFATLEVQAKGQNFMNIRGQFFK